MRSSPAGSASVTYRFSWPRGRSAGPRCISPRGPFSFRKADDHERVNRLCRTRGRWDASRHDGARPLLRPEAPGARDQRSIMLFEETVPVGTTSLYHLHRDSDEVAWVLAGEITFKIGDEVSVGGPGSSRATSPMPGRARAAKPGASCFSTPPPPPVATSRSSRSARPGRSTTLNATRSARATAGKSSVRTRCEVAEGRQAPIRRTGSSCCAQSRN